ncbi:MAG: Holliday junction branch migration protein RuvA [Pseudomonadota bacterium]
MIIGRLRGTIAATGTDHIMIDVGGVGYVAQAGTRLLARSRAGDEAELHIETRVTENSITLFAFATDEERAWFVRLQDVHGVAGKAAMALLDALTPSELMDAIALGDAVSIQRAKGVGKKLAERIVGELGGKPPPMGRFGSVGKSAVTSANGGAEPIASMAGGTRGEAVSALTNLGYGQTEAARAVASAAKAGADDVGALIKAALKELAG